MPLLMNPSRREGDNDRMKKNMLQMGQHNNRTFIKEGNNMKRRTARKTAIIPVILAGILMLAGCGAPAATSGTGSVPTAAAVASSAAEADASNTAGDTASADKELNLFNWTEYMPESVLQAFTEETGIKVNYTTFSSNEEMLAKIKSGEKGMYDVTVASDYMVSTMIADGMLAPFDKGKIPNIANIDPTYLNMKFDPDNGYSVPYMLSPAILCYDKTKVPGGLKSYKDLLSPDLSNSLVILDDQRMVIGLAELANGLSVNETDPAKLKTVQDWLVSLKSNIKLFDSDTPKSAMISGETAAGYMWCAEVALAMQDNPNVVAVYPEEGTVMMIDSFVIPDGARNMDAAQKFIDFVLRPENSKLVSDEFPYVNPNKAAQPLLPDSFKNNPASNPSVTEMAKGKLLENLGDKAKLYDDLWTAFKNQ